MRRDALPEHGITQRTNAQLRYSMQITLTYTVARIEKLVAEFIPHPRDGAFQPTSEFDAIHHRCSPFRRCNERETAERMESFG